MIPREPLDVLFLSWNFPPALGGMEYVVENLFDGLRNAGHQVRLLTAGAKSCDPRSDVARSPIEGLPAYLLFALVRGFRESMCKRPDVILCGSVTAGLPGILLARAFGLPVVTLCYGSDIVHSGWVYQRVLRWILRGSTGICAISGYTRQIVVAKGITPSAVSVIHPGVRLQDFDVTDDVPGGDLLGSLQGRRVLLSVGRLIRRKGIMEFIQHVMPSLARQLPEVVYVVVGDDATQSLIHRERLRDVIARRVEELGLSEHVRLAGRISRESLVRLYFRSDVFVLPCLDLADDMEGFGIVICEAALAGVPAVATATGGIPDAIEDGVTGILVPPGQYHDMESAIRRLLQDEALRARMGRAASDRARESFGWDVIVTRYEQLLSEVASPADRSA